MLHQVSALEVQGTSLRNAQLNIQEHNRRSKERYANALPLEEAAVSQQVDAIARRQLESGCKMLAVDKTSKKIV